jgi:hypothetical protein
MSVLLFFVSVVILATSAWILSLYTKLRVFVRKVEGAKANVIAYQITAREHLAKITTILDVHYGFEKFRVESYMKTVEQVTNTPIAEKTLMAMMPKISLPQPEIGRIIESELHSLDQLRREFLAVVTTYNATVTEMNSAKSGFFDGLVNDRFFGIPDGLYLNAEALHLLPLFGSERSNAVYRREIT